MVEEAREAREKLERQEAERRAAQERDQIDTLDHEMVTPRHLSDEPQFFSEVSPDTADAQRQSESIFLVISISFLIWTPTILAPGRGMKSEGVSKYPRSKVLDR